MGLCLPIRRMAIREARRPSGGVVGDARDVWCQRRVYARRVCGAVSLWVKAVMKGARRGRVPCRLFATLLLGLWFVDGNWAVKCCFW